MKFENGDLVRLDFGVYQPVWIISDKFNWFDEPNEFVQKSFVNNNPQYYILVTDIFREEIEV